MNAGGIVTIFFIAIALVWGIWLIFKTDFMKGGDLSKLIGYFVGVILTLIIVLWITSRFLPWWAIRLVEDTRGSQNVQALEEVSQELWNEAMNNPVVVSTAVPAPTQPPTGAQPTPSATEEPGDTSQQSVGEQRYIVQSGDTLYRISRRFNVPVDAIKQRNTLVNDNIRVGQELIIPAP